jgi:hypothetical protein
MQIVRRHREVNGGSRACCYGLTERQLWAYMFIERAVHTTGRFPKLSEIARHLHIGRPNAHFLVAALIERGRVRRDMFRRLHLAGREPVRIERIQYFQYDDASKQLVEWPRDRRTGP